MKSWLRAYVFITCLWSFFYTSQDLPRGSLLVICDLYHIYSRPDPTYYCKRPALRGKCNRYFWNKDLEGKNIFHMPRTLKAGWEAYLTGVLTKNTRASIDLRNNNGSLRLTFDIRKKYSYFKESVTINEGWNKSDGSFWNYDLEHKYYPRPYPFSTGKEFTIKFVAERDNLVALYINGRKYFYQTLKHPIHDFTIMEFCRDMEARLVNLWAQSEDEP